ncbi:PD-(D/E)XK nuclease family protein [Clostridium sp. DJ247]|uniref:PD-(D/E)XK nuclease family protein n=1 Tax=Clostridium sp. DJ247 TaxID=2726188 RepID=UPI00162513A6|nr:PD-(D/E)XK nuclease family protein [Clostridium sp. DJ247]MBC2581057.1 PD-(D/E)XK nuclease family protein [Clostridium sp. DJ247]
MIDVRKLKYFYYSQNSLNTFYKCPLKFKLKYIDNMSWRNDSPMDRGYNEGIKLGLDFHLMCERYFSDIPLGNCVDNSVILNWVKALKDRFILQKDYIYLPEYEIKMKKKSIRLQAKYDLIIITPEGRVEIWDWKTENRKLSLKEMEQRFQTMVYMYVLKEEIKNLFNIDIIAENIKMFFWQPLYADDIIAISYSGEKHTANEIGIEMIIKTIDNYNFLKDFNKTLYYKNCRFCEFNYFCNNETVNFNFLEEYT